MTTPPQGAVYYHFDAEGGLLYVGCATNPFARFGNHRCVSPWGRSVARIEIKWFDSHAEALEFELAEIKRLNPPHNGTFTARKRETPPNEGFRFVADWQARFGGCSFSLGRAAGCSVKWSSRFAREVTHPIYRVARRLTIGSGGYIPLLAFDRGVKFQPLTDAEAREEWARVTARKFPEDAAVLAFASSFHSTHSEVTQ